MTTKQYYVFALTSPLWLPLLFSPLAFGQTPFKEAVGLLLMALVFGGIPYVIFLVGLSLCFQEGDMQSLRSSTWFFPLIFAGLIGLLTFILMGISAIFFVFYALVFGYGYVLLTEIGYRLSRYFQVIIDSPDIV